MKKKMNQQKAKEKMIKKMVKWGQVPIDYFGKLCNF